MLKFLPILLPLFYGWLLYRLSMWRTARTLDENAVPLVDQRFQPFLRQMAQALEIQQIKVFLYEIEPINGLAAADGRIFITRGFYQKFHNGEVSGPELASVIAHELGHVALGHSKRRMIDFTAQNALRGFLAAALSRFIPFVGPWIAGMVISLVSAKLSRQDEYEADAYAAALLTKSGIGIGPQITMFEKLSKMQGNLTGKAPAWLMSHPATQDRIAALQKLQSEWQVG